METNSKINVLFMVSWYGPQGPNPTGGIFHYEQAKELNKYCNCAIYYPYDRNITDNVVSDVEWGIKTYRSKYSLEKKVRNRICMFQAMKRIVKEFNPDIIHGNVATEAGRFAVILGKIFGIPVIISEHSSTDYSGVREFPHHFYANYVYGLSKFNTCVSDYLKEQLSEIFPKYEFHVVYNAISLNDNRESDNEYKVAGKVNLCCVAGFYDETIKGIQFLLPAFKKLIDDGEDVFLHLVGGGDYLSHYIELAKELGIYDATKFYDAVPRMTALDIIESSDFIVSASLVESFGCFIAEGVMLGKPAVGTRCGGPQSIIDDENGILVEKGSTEALYSALKEMVHSYHNYDRENISRKAADKFSIENITKQYIDIYKQVLNKNNE